jgi:4-alpha-glucanotransferase
MYCGIDAGDTAQKACRAVIRCLWQTAAQLTVAPVQDFLDLGPEGRINTPGVLEDNWMFRLEPDQLARLDINWIRRLNLAMERTKSE